MTKEWEAKWGEHGDGGKRSGFWQKEKNKDAAAIVFVCCLWNLNGIVRDGRKPQQLFLSIRRLKIEENCQDGKIHK
jgi:hypothetical protein